MNFFSDLKNKNILVMGASQGIGKQLALDLKKIGANPIISSRNEQALKSFADEFSLNYIVCDITDDSSIKDLASSIIELDGVCVLSGISKLTPPKMIQRKIIDPQISTNLTGPLSLLGFLLNKRKIKDHCSIIFTSASGRLCNPPCSAAYAASKMGLLGMARSLVMDLSFEKKIRINTASFDYVDTSMAKGNMVIDDKDIIGVSPVEYASLPFLFLLSSRSKWINGQLVAADSGRMLGKARYA